jgi:hypothetical protein
MYVRVLFKTVTCSGLKVKSWGEVVSLDPLSQWHSSAEVL